MNMDIIEPYKFNNMQKIQVTWDDNNENRKYRYLHHREYLDVTEYDIGVVFKLLLSRFQDLSKLLSGDLFELSDNLFNIVLAETEHTLKEIAYILEENIGIISLYSLNDTKFSSHSMNIIDLSIRNKKHYR